MCTPILLFVCANGNQQVRLHVWRPVSHTARREVPQTVVLRGHPTTHDLRSVQQMHTSLEITNQSSGLVMSKTGRLHKATKVLCTSSVHSYAQDVLLCTLEWHITWHYNHDDH